MIQEAETLFDVNTWPSITAVAWIVSFPLLAPVYVNDATPLLPVVPLPRLLFAPVTVKVTATPIFGVPSWS